MEKLSLTLGGMGCGGCVKNVRRVLDTLPGVVVENVAVGSAVMIVDPARSSKQAVEEALSKAGYPVQEVVAVAGQAAEAKGGHCGV